jgi:hypothetical protein
MFRAYIAWPESEIAVIKTAMGLGDPSPPMNDSRGLSATAQLATKIGTTDNLPQANCLKAKEKIGGGGDPPKRANRA